MLKKSLILCTLLNLSTAMAAETMKTAATYPQLQLEVEPLPLFINVGSVSANAAFENFIAGLNLFYGKNSIDALEKTGLTTKGIGFSGVYHFDGVHQDGIYIKSKVSYSNTEFSLADDIYTAEGEDHFAVNIYDIRAIAGYHWEWQNNVYCNLGAGVSYARETAERPVLYDMPGNREGHFRKANPFGPAVELALGYTF